MKRFAIPIALVAALALLFTAAAPQMTSAQPDADGLQYEIQANGA